MKELAKIAITVLVVLVIYDKFIKKLVNPNGYEEGYDEFDNE